MPLSSETRYRDRALALRQELGLGYSRVDPISVLRSRGAEVVRRPAGGAGVLDGLYHREQGVTVVFINSAMPAIRQRFTAAHELAHDLFDGEAADAVNVVDQNVIAPADARERLMNAFAGAFLVDPHGVDELVAQGHHDLDLVAHVVLRFEVSVQAAAVELRKANRITQADCDTATANGVTTKTFMEGRRLAFEPDTPPTSEIDPDRYRRVRAAYRAGLLTVDTAAPYLWISAEAASEWLEQQGATPREGTDPLVLSTDHAEPAAGG